MLEHINIEIVMIAKCLQKVQKRQRICRILRIIVPNIDVYNLVDTIYSCRNRVGMTAQNPGKPYGLMHDKEVTVMFEARGWTVLRIWECELRKKNETALIHRLLNLVEL